MKKTNDWFFAGTIAGAISGIFHLLYNAGLLLIGIPTSTFWKAMGGLFYNPQLLATGLAQIHGAIDAIGVSVTNGILLCLTLKLTGKDYMYTKSIVLSATSAYFLFLVVYPQTGLGKENLFSPWVSLFGHIVFNGLLTGYLLNKFYSFKQTGNES